MCRGRRREGEEEIMEEGGQGKREGECAGVGGGGRRKRKRDERREGERWCRARLERTAHRSTHVSLRLRLPLQEESTHTAP